MVSRLAIIIFLAISSQLFGQISREQLIGEYKYINSDLDSAALKLSADSSFSYAWKFIDHGGITTGKWSKDDKYIYLTSDTLPNTQSDKMKRRYILKTTNETSINHIRFILKDMNGVPIEGADCWSNKSSFKTDSLGVGTIHGKKCTFISVDMDFADAGFTFKTKKEFNVYEVTALNVNLKYLYKRSEKLYPLINEGTLYLREAFITKNTLEFKKVK